VHLVGGVVGTLAIGFLASSLAPSGVDGLFYGGGPTQLGRQTIGVVVVLIYSFVVSGLLGLAIHKVWGFRIQEEHEVSGIDLVVHAESAYDYTPLPEAGTASSAAELQPRPIGS
jgi:Amt family ammonium transporter